MFAKNNPVPRLTILQQLDIVKFSIADFKKKIKKPSNDCKFISQLKDELAEINKLIEQLPNQRYFVTGFFGEKMKQDLDYPKQKEAQKIEAARLVNVLDCIDLERNGLELRPFK